MTRNAFVTQLEKRLADLFPSWEAKEQELTAEDIGAVWEQMADVMLTSVVRVEFKQPDECIGPEVKA